MADTKWVCAKAGHVAKPSQHYTTLSDRYALGRCRSCKAASVPLVRAELYVDVKTKQPDTAT